MLRLQIIEEGVAPRLVTFNREAIVIGRTDACDLQLTGKGVSSQHCKITRIPGGYRLEDLGSTNGTYVNRKRVGPPQTVTGYDEIVMAIYQLKLLDEVGPVRQQTGSLPVQSGGASPNDGSYSTPPLANSGAQPITGPHSAGPHSQPPPATHPMIPALMTPAAGATSAVTQLPPSGHFDDAGWLREWQRLDKLAAEWIATRRERGRLLRGDKLTHARSWLAQARRRQPPPKREHKEFILASSRASQLRILRNVTLGGLVLGGGAVAAVVIVRKPDVTELTPSMGGIEAVPNTTDPLPETPDKVDSSQSDALAAKAEALLDAQPSVAAWIAIEALLRLPSPRELDSRGSRAERVLRRALAGMRGRPLPGHDGELAAMAMSDDGRWVASAASGSESSAVRLWQLDRGATTPQMLRSHVGAVHRLAFLPDGTKLVSAGDEDKLYLWDLRDPDTEPSGTPLAGASAGTSALSLSHDGRLLLAGGRDGSVKLFDLSASPPGGVVLGSHGGPVNAVAIAVDGARALSVADDGFALSWRLSGAAAAGKPLQLEGHMGAVLDGALSPDGRWAVTGGADGQGMLWDLHTARPSASVRVLNAHAGAKVVRVAVTPDSRYAITGSTDHRLAVWKLFVAAPEVSAAKDPRATAEITELFVRGPSAGDADRAGRSQFAYSAAADGHVRSLDLARMDTQVAGNDAPVFDGPITAFALDRRGLVFAAGARDGSARIDDIDEKAGAGLALVGRGHASEVLDVAIAAGGTRVLTGGADGTAKLWDATRVGRLHELHTLTGHTGRVNAVAVAPGGKIAATGGEDGVLRMWDLSAADPVSASRPFTGHTAEIYDLVFGPDGNVLVSISADKHARIWKMKQKDPAVGVVVLTHDDEVTKVAIGPDSRWLLTGSIGQLNLWDLRLENPASATKPLAEHESDITGIAMSPKGRWAASADALGKVILWDLEHKDFKPLRLRRHEEGVDALAFDPTGEWLATGGRDKRVVAWRVSSKNPDEGAIELTGHVQGVGSLAWTSDGKWLMSASNDGSVRAWPIGAADPVAGVMVLDGHDGLISGLAVESTQYVVTSSYDKSVRVWPLASQEMIAAACVRLGEELGDTQWSELIGGARRPACSGPR
jgi:WD40 repeat protein/pSer/pThr/pTyr-binding forkhead associated (FHA) protein